MLNLIVKGTKIKNTYLLPNDKTFRVRFNSTNWDKYNKKIIFECNEIIKTINIENGKEYDIPDILFGKEFFVNIIGSTDYSSTITEKMLVRTINAEGMAEAIEQKMDEMLEKFEELKSGLSELEELSKHVSNKNNPHLVTKEHLGVCPATTDTEGLMSASDKKKLDGIAIGAQKNAITGIKGNTESEFRTGDVNITPENIGAAIASHTHPEIIDILYKNNYFIDKWGTSGTYDGIGMNGGIAGSTVSAIRSQNGYLISVLNSIAIGRDFGFRSGNGIDLSKYNRIGVVFDTTGKGNAILDIFDVAKTTIIASAQLSFTANSTKQLLVINIASITSGCIGIRAVEQVVNEAFTVNVAEIYLFNNR